MNKQHITFLFSYALKTILRQKGRSFFIIFSVSLAVIIAVWVVAFFDGLNRQIENAVVKTNLGHIQIQEIHFGETTDSSFPLPLTSELEEILKNSSSLISYSPEVLLSGNLSTPEGASALELIGIVPSLHEHFLPIKKHLSSGRFLSSDKNNEIIIGHELAKMYKLKPNDFFVFNYQDQDGELRSELLKIVGIYHYNSPGFQKKYIYSHQGTWKKLFLKKSFSQKILFNRIPLMTTSDSQKDLEHIKKSLNAKFQNLSANKKTVLKTWKELNPEMAVVLDFHDGMIRFFFLIIGFTITMTILTPVRMLWQERFKELKMMNIIGVPYKKFWEIGFYETMIMIFFSGVLSSIFLTSLILYQSKFGVDFRFLNDGVSIERAGIKLPGIIYPYLTMEQIMMTFVFVFIVLALSYSWSIHRTLKKLEES